MIRIKINFDGGRYHATPWNHNVNEGIPEWPPSIHRLFRAIVDAYYRKHKDNLDESTLKAILFKLANDTPEFYVPEFTVSYADYFMPAGLKRQYESNKKKKAKKKDVESSTDTKGGKKNGEDGSLREDKTLIYDAFVVVRDPLFIVFKEVKLEDKEKEILDRLLRSISYLGRSSSWVSMSLSDDPVEANCRPDKNGQYTVALPVVTQQSKKDNSTLDAFSADIGQSADTWYDFLTKGTLELSKYDPNPSITFKNYTIRSEKKTPDLEGKETKIKAILLKLVSKSPLRLYDAVILSDAIHKKILRESARTLGYIPPKFSGRKPDGTLLKGQRHIYIVPLDMDWDGFIDHVLIRSRENFNEEELKVLGNLRYIGYNKYDVYLFSENSFTMNESDAPFKSKSWRSLTPFIPPRHYRKGRGPLEEWMLSEVKKELRYHFIIDNEDDEIESIEFVKFLNMKGRSYYWSLFKRQRKYNDQNLAYGISIRFKDEKIGPFAIGMDSHFGMGVLVPDGEFK